MNNYIEEQKAEYENAMEHLKKELSNIRTGRANPSMLENVQVQAYDVFQPLNQLASINLSDSQSMTIEPWDKTILKNIEVSLSKTDLGLSVVNTGERIIAKVPSMTEEIRLKMVKLLGEKIEDTKISIRQVRDKIKENILEAEKNKEITEDDRYKFIADLDNFTTDYNKKIEEIRDEKEESLMTV